ncbi:MAG: 2Fe-2S iron-sulfur cluster binding domain-containing protein [Hyphomicrobiaceae bacterium]
MEIVIESRAGTCPFTCEPGEKILFAGLRAGLTLPYDCATGTCGMCKARVRSGTVETIWPQAPALAKLQPGKGDILMCQSRATSNAVLRVPGSVVLSQSGPLPRYGSGRVHNVELLTDDVMHFELALPSPMTFDAGQFVVLTAPGINGARAYSMVNHALEASTLELVIKKKIGGGLSEWLFEADRTGLELGVFGPLGRATFRPENDRDFVCIAGGSGIAGILSILERATAAGHFQNHKGRVFFGVRALRDGFYLDRFSRLVIQSNGALEVILALSHEVVEGLVHPQFAAIQIASGFVHDVADARLEADCRTVTTFVAGPPPMVDGAIRVLLGHGVPSTQIRYDKFG